MARLLALALGGTAASALTQDEAQCIAKFDGGQTFVWVGDSNMRYESLAFNAGQRLSVERDSLPHVI